MNTLRWLWLSLISKPLPDVPEKEGVVETVHLSGR